MPIDVAMRGLLRQRRDVLKRYGIALGSAALALLVRGAMPVPQGTTIYQLPLAAVVLSAWYGGRGPGLLSAAASAAGILYWFIPPADSFALPANYALGLGLHLLLAVLLTEFSVARRRVERALADSEKKLTAANERLMKAQEEERSRIAAELHDGIVQQMTTANLLLGVAHRQVPPDSPIRAALDEAQEILVKTGSDARHLSHELHPAVLKEAGLPKALSVYCKEFSTTRGVAVSCEADSAVKDLSAGTALALYRIAQEALANAAKHSKATQIRVQLACANGIVRLIVSDDGVGFTPARPGDSGGVGLANMRERVRHLSGTFVLESEPSRGTTVRAEVPLRPA